jgi:hypothetical protein
MAYDVALAEWILLSEEICWHNVLLVLIKKPKRGGETSV